MASTRYAILLRGINIGNYKLPMAQFRSILTELGHTEVKTLMASGQAVVRSDRTPAQIVKELRPLLESQAALKTDIFVRSGADLAGIVAGCPFPGAEEAGNRHAVVFLERAPEAAELAPLEKSDWGTDEYRVEGSEIYLRLPGGFANSKLSIAVGKIRGVPATTRNWNTVIKLRDLT